ncbi:MAG TPA: hypothetical protein VLK30_10880 [Candidatus Limnocylindrales bacterium]|nr:hypothetical protein [Candidatus Limnocylindrales bacterium]
MSSVTYDQLRTLYRTLLVFATVGVVILAIGLIEFAYFERPGVASGIHARIVGVYKYDPAQGATGGPDRTEFARNEQFAAVVDWNSVPGNTTVDARWYDSFGSIEGQVGPALAADLVDHSTVPVAVPQGYHYVLPGRYTFVVERLQGGVPVEVLARRFELVDRT